MVEETSPVAAPELAVHADDEPGFIQLVRAAISAELQAKAVHGLFVVRIANWFDHRWRNYSGNGRVAYGHYTGLKSYDPDTALDEFHRSGTKTTFPPFTPNRVISQNYYGKVEDGSYVLDTNGPRIHWAFKESSCANLHRRIATHNNSALFVWFSSNSLQNKRGSLMVYRANGSIVTSWYASFSLDGAWRVVRTDGTSRQHLVRWLAAA